VVAAPGFVACALSNLPEPRIAWPTRLQLAWSPVLLWGLTSGSQGTADDAVYLSYRMGHTCVHLPPHPPRRLWSSSGKGCALTFLLLSLSITHKKVDAGPLQVLPATRRRGEPPPRVPLEVHLPRARCNRLQRIATTLVPLLRALLADVARQKNFFGVVRRAGVALSRSAAPHALTRLLPDAPSSPPILAPQALDDEEVTERLRQGPLLYAAPWGGGLRIVVPQPRKSGPQRRGELAVDWASLPEGCLVLSEDGDEPRRVSSLQEAMALMGAFDAPRAAMTVLRALNRMRTRALERRQRLAAGGHAVQGEPSEKELEETAMEVIGFAVLHAARRRRKNKAKAAQVGRGNEDAPAVAPGADAAQGQGVAAAGSVHPALPPPSPHHALRAGASSGTLSVHLTALRGDDAAQTARGSWDRLMSWLAHLLADGERHPEGDLPAHTSLNTVALLMCAPAQGAGAVRTALDEAGLPELCIQLIALREGHHLLVFPPAHRAGMLLRDDHDWPQTPRHHGLARLPSEPVHGSARPPAGDLRRVATMPLHLPPRPPARDGAGVTEAPPVPRLRLRSDSAPGPRGGRDLPEEAGGSQAAPAGLQALGGPSRLAAPHQMPRLRLPDGPSIEVGDDDGAHTPAGAAPSTVIHIPSDDVTAHLLSLLILALLTPDGTSLAVNHCAPGSALPLALCVLQAHVRSRAGRQLLPGLAWHAHHSPLPASAAALLRLLSPQLWWGRPLYSPGPRLGRGAYAVVFACTVSGPAAQAQGRPSGATAALKVVDAPPLMPVRSLTVAGFNAACEVAATEVHIARDVFAEVTALRALAHRHVAPGLLDFGALSDGYALVVERCWCSLRVWRGSHMHEAPASTAAASRLYAAVYAACLDCCARASACLALHLDIKADNVLLQPRPGVVLTDAMGGEPSPFWSPAAVSLDPSELPFTVLLGDWGSSRLYAHDARHGQSREVPPLHTGDEVHDEDTARSLEARAFTHGTPRHTGTECVKAPEMLRAGARAAGAGQERGVAAPVAVTSGAPADVWAAACLLSDVFCGVPLYGQEAEQEWVRFFVRLTSPGAPIVPQAASQALGAIHPGLEGFLQAVLKRQPSARPSMGTTARRWSKLLHSTLDAGLPVYVRPPCRPPPPLPPPTPSSTSRPGSAYEAGCELNGEDVSERVALHTSPVDVAPGLWVGPLPEHEAGTQRFHAMLRCAFSAEEGGSGVRNDNASGHILVLLPPHPGSQSAAAINTALDNITEARDRPVLLACGSPEAGPAVGVVAAAWLLHSRPPGLHLDAMAALDSVTRMAPGAAPDGRARAVLCDWVERHHA
jgi:serine/threonine protein kinase